MLIFKKKLSVRLYERLLDNIVFYVVSILVVLILIPFWLISQVILGFIGIFETNYYDEKDYKGQRGINFQD